MFWRLIIIIRAVIIARLAGLWHCINAADSAKCVITVNIVAAHGAMHRGAPFLHTSMLSQNAIHVKNFLLTILYIPG